MLDPEIWYWAKKQEMIVKSSLEMLTSAPDNALGGPDVTTNFRFSSNETVYAF